ncbi:hypothetical protein [Edwardsiella tarda]
MNVIDFISSSSYESIRSTLALIISVIATPVSAYWSYRNAISGEKRKEFNAITEPVLAVLEMVECSWSRRESLSVDPFDAESIAKIRRRLSSRKVKIYDELWSRYYLCAGRIKLNEQDYEDAFNDGVLVLKKLQKIHRLR